MDEMNVEQTKYEWESEQFSKNAMDIDEMIRLREQELERLQEMKEELLKMKNRSELLQKIDEVETAMKTAWIVKAPENEEQEAMHVKPDDFDSVKKHYLENDSFYAEDIKNDISTLHLTNDHLSKFRARTELSLLRQDKFVYAVMDKILTVHYDVKIKIADKALAADKGLKEKIEKMHLPSAIKQMEEANKRRARHQLPLLSDPSSFFPPYAQRILCNVEKRINKNERLLKSTEHKKELKLAPIKFAERQTENYRDAVEGVLSNEFVITKRMEKGHPSLIDGKIYAHDLEDMKDALHQKDANLIQSIYQKSKEHGKINFDEAARICVAAGFNAEKINAAYDDLKKLEEKGYKFKDKNDMICSLITSVKPKEINQTREEPGETKEEPKEPAQEQEVKETTEKVTEQDVPFKDQNPAPEQPKAPEQKKPEPKAPEVKTGPSKTEISEDIVNAFVDERKEPEKENVKENTRSERSEKPRQKSPEMQKAEAFSKELFGDRMDSKAIVDVCRASHNDTAVIQEAFDRMKHAEDKGKEISNPTGYMIATIKRLNERERTEDPAAVPKTEAMDTRDKEKTVEKATPEPAPTVPEKPAQKEERREERREEPKPEKDLDIFEKAKLESRAETMNSIAVRSYDTICENLRPNTFVEFSSNGHDFRIAANSEGVIETKEYDFESGKFEDISKDDAVTEFAKDIKPVQKAVKSVVGEPEKEEQVKEKTKKFDPERDII